VALRIGRRLAHRRQADGANRDAVARAVIDTGWLGAGLARTETGPASMFPLGICLLAVNTDFACGRDVARDPTQDLFNPALSPDGTVVAVVRAPRSDVGAGPIVLYGASTAAPVRDLVGGENTQPSWSPDGKRIAFERGGDLYVARATGAPRERRVGKGGQQPDLDERAGVPAAPAPAASSRRACARACVSERRPCGSARRRAARTPRSAPRTR
jgi:WD40-like Beta Propeller Repeat